MNYIVVDLEWNQSNTGREPEVQSLPFEVIDVGAIRMDEHGHMIGEFNQLVKPQVYQNMHRITSRIIHLHMQDLQRGLPFPEVMEQFLDFCGEDYILCTWGPTDIFEFQRNMKFFGMDTFSDGPLKYLDVQKLFSIAYEDGKTRRALEYAIDFLEIEKDIPFHRAFSDAYYTGKVFALIPEETRAYYSYDTFMVPAGKEDEIHVEFPTYAKYISREFEDRHAAMEDKEVSSTKCYLCGKTLRKKIRWFSTNSGKHYFSAAECPVHGYIKYKVRIRKAETGNVYVVKTAKCIPEAKFQELSERRAEMAAKKKEKRKKN